MEVLVAVCIITAIVLSPVLQLAAVWVSFTLSCVLVILFAALVPQLVTLPSDYQIMTAMVVPTIILYVVGVWDMIAERIK